MKNYVAEYRLMNETRYQDKNYWKRLRICIKCKEEKLFSEYSLSRSSATGILTICKICDNDKRKAYEKNNAPYVLERNRKYRDKNKDKVAKNRHAHYLKVKSDENYRLAKKRYKQQRRINEAIGTCKYTLDQLQAKIRFYGGVCYLCLEPYDSLNFHLDHVKPLSRGGLNILSNLRPTHPHCNLRKNKRWFGPHRLGELI